jgi:hypothetical protein
MKSAKSGRLFQLCLLILLGTCSIQAGDNSPTNVNASSIPVKKIFLTNWPPPDLTNIQSPLMIESGAISSGFLKIKAVAGQTNCVEFARGQEIYRFPTQNGYIYTDPVLSTNGKYACFIVKQYQQLGKNEMIYTVTADYDSLVLFKIPGASEPLSNIVSNRVLNKAELEKLIPSRRAWVSSLKELSSDGERILLQCHVQDANDAPQIVKYPKSTYSYLINEKQLARVPESPIGNDKK